MPEFGLYFRFIFALSPYNLPSGSSDRSTRKRRRCEKRSLAIVLLYGTKCAQQLSYGFNILDKLESCPHENQIPYGDMDFLKKVSKVTDFR